MIPPQAVPLTHSEPPPYDSPLQLAMSTSSDPRPQGPPVRCSRLVSNFWPTICLQKMTFELLTNKSGHLENFDATFASDHTAAPAHSLTSPSHCVFLFIISASGIFGQTKGCSFTGCLLAATQSKIMPCFCTFSCLLPKFAVKLCLCCCLCNSCTKLAFDSLLPFFLSNSLFWLDLGHPITFSLIDYAFF